MLLVCKGFDKMKKKKVNRLYTCLIIVLICLLAIGYATVESIILDITGSGNADLQDGIYITEVNYDKSVGADTENSEIIYAHQTLLNSNIILSETDQNSSITYEITIYNSNDTCYAFDEVKYIVGDETYSNEDITFELNNLSHSYILCSKKQ